MDHAGSRYAARKRRVEIVPFRSFPFRSFPRTVGAAGRRPDVVRAASLPPSKKKTFSRLVNSLSSRSLSAATLGSAAARASISATRAAAFSVRSAASLATSSAASASLVRGGPRLL